MRLPESPRDRVITAVETDCESVRFTTPLLLIGEFQCAVEHARFRDAGRIRKCVLRAARGEWFQSHSTGAVP